MEWSWFDLTWPWIGGVGAVMLLTLLFGTNLLRSDLGTSRWRDRVWLSWLAVFAYLAHNVEEYGIDLFGRKHEFPDTLCINLGLPAYPDCPVPPSFFLAVNLSMFWIAAPLAALLSRRHPLIGLSLYSVVFANALAHIVPFMTGLGYSAGTLTAFMLFLPLSVWIAYACFGSGGLSYKAMTLLMVHGVILHAVLLGSSLLFRSGAISSSVLVSIQCLNAVLFFLIPWLGEKWRAGALIRPAPIAT